MMRYLLVVGALFSLAAFSAGTRETKQPIPPLGKVVAAGSYGKLPLAFEPNLGQADPRVRFLARGGGMTGFFTDTEAVMVLGWSEQAVVRMKLVGGRAARQVQGLEKLPGISNYFIGNDPKKWRADVPHYGRIEYVGVYPGIDLVWYGNQRQLEYDFVVAAGADPKQIQVAYEGVESVGLAPNGELVLRTAVGDVRQQQPKVYQEIGGKRVEVAARYTITARNRVRFELAKYDHKRELRIDPVVLVYSTYLGGTAADSGLRIAVDGTGSAYVSGWTQSTNFLTQSPYQAAFQGGSDVFVTKLTPAGDALVYSTYLGGSNDEYGYGIAVDGAGAAYVAGYTNSTNFPTESAFQATNRGAYDVFVTKLTPAGTALVYSTYLGGGGIDCGLGIVVDATGSAYLTGSTASANFPTQSAYQATFQGGTYDAFVTKLTPAGDALVYSTYLGGSGEDGGGRIALDAVGSVYVTGFTESADFPTQSAYQATYQGAKDVFVTKLTPAGDALVYSTYLGGSGDDVGFGIAADGAGSAYVTGDTTSTNFPTQSPYQATYQGGTDDSFVTKLAPAGNALVYSTYLGGSGGEQGWGIAVDAAGSAYVTGYTASTNFPTQSPYQATHQGGINDAFVTKLTPAGSALSYSTYLGGSGGEEGHGIAVDGAGSAYVTGGGYSSDFPTQSPYQATYLGGNRDAFVTKLSGHRVPTSAFRDADGAVRLLQYGTANTDYAGGVFAGNPGATQNAVGDTFVVNRDTYNALWANVFDVTTQTWGSWTYGGGATQGDPAVAVATNGTAYIAARDSWNSYWITSYTPASGFGTWTYLAGIFSTDPVISASPDGSLYIVGKDTWNSLWSGQYIPETGFQGWQFGGGIVRGKPSLAVGTDNVAYIAARDMWDSLWMARVQGNSWLSWSYGGGIMSADPQVAASGGTTYVALTDPWQVLWYVSYTSGGWQSWVMTGGVLQDFAPAALVGELYVVGRDSNNDLWWYRMQGNQWTNAGNRGVAAGALAASPR